MEWMWCISCERCFRRGEHRSTNGLQLCPYGDCDAVLAADTRPWPQMLRVNPDYPSIPNPNVVYPLIRGFTHARALAGSRRP